VGEENIDLVIYDYGGGGVPERLPKKIRVGYLSVGHFLIRDSSDG
jgi:hypothetical protein